jgi:hypothetical protein
MTGDVASYGAGVPLLTCSVRRRRDSVNQQARDQLEHLFWGVIAPYEPRHVPAFPASSKGRGQRWTSFRQMWRA